MRRLVAEGAGVYRLKCKAGGLLNSSWKCCKSFSPHPVSAVGGTSNVLVQERQDRKPPKLATTNITEGSIITTTTITTTSTITSTTSCAQSNSPYSRTATPPHARLQRKTSSSFLNNHPIEPPPGHRRPLALQTSSSAMSAPQFWSTPFRYMRWAAHEKPAIFFSVIIGSLGPVALVALPPVRRYFGDVDPAPIPLTYPIPPGPRQIPKGYDDE